MDWHRWKLAHATGPRASRLVRVGTAPAAIVGQTLHFQLLDDLTVHQVTKRETFDMTLTVKSASELSGTVQTTARYEDFNLSIPDVPFVSHVSDNVTLTLSFTATSAAHS